jgi:hypothetical protein
LPSEPIAVLLLYVNPLLGEGLERLLAAEPGLVVTALHLGTTATLSTAIEQEADVVIFEEGGSLGLEHLLERTTSPVVIAVSLHTGDVWTLRRDDLRGRSEDVVDELVATCLGRADAAARAVRGGRRRPVPVEIEGDARAPTPRAFRPA